LSHTPTGQTSVQLGDVTSPHLVLLKQISHEVSESTHQPDCDDLFRDNSVCVPYCWSLLRHYQQ